MIELENKKRLKAFVVGVVKPKENEAEMARSLEELGSLVEAIDFDVEGGLLVSLRKIEPRFLLTKGKKDEVISAALANEVDLIVFDCGLSPSQQRNWEKESGAVVIDREEVILDIFAARAQTKEASLQVELARREYDLPRLTRAWSHLSRQRGGQKGTRDAGETQLELDRRLVESRIAKLKKDLEVVRSTRDVMRKQRMQRPIPSISIVGYTNAGKSTLLNALTGSDVYVENQLFATLDPTSRVMKLPSGREIILTDTVGFIRNLPHHLIDAFRSTLEETTLSDFLIHVVDLSDDDFPDQIRTTLEVLEELGTAEKERILVFNKEDLTTETQKNLALSLYPDSYFLSARDKIGFERLFDEVEARLKALFTVKRYLIPFSEYHLISQMRKAGTILSEEHLENGTLVQVALSAKLEGQLSNFLF